MQVVCTQPRRAAAAMTAQRVAEEMNTEIGAKVGFRARFQDMLTPVRSQLLPWAQSHPASATNAVLT